MINNDVLRSIRYMLDLSEPKVIEIARLADSQKRGQIPQQRAQSAF
jgi:uncharacterized protein YehS (DUF1456 family)